MKIKNELKFKLFNSFVKYMNCNDINYALLGDTRNYPLIIESDIDIVIDSECFKKVNQLIKIFCDNEGFVLCNSLDHEITAKYFVIGAYDDKEIAIIAFDICSDYYKNNRKLIGSDELLLNRKKSKLNNKEFEDYYILNDPIAFLYYFVKKIKKGYFSEDSLDYLNTLIRENEYEINELLLKYFKNIEINELKKLFQGKDTLEHRLFNKLEKSINQNRPIRYDDIILSLKLKVRRIIEPTGLVVCFLGCDGSGKSSIINRFFENELVNTGFRSFSYYHLFPTKSKKASVVSRPIDADPQGKQRRSKFLSNLKLIYLLIKYIYGYWAFVYPKIVKSHIVVFDRYFYDLYVDPMRYRHNGSLWLTNFVGKIIPAPDIVYFVNAPAEMIYSRKKELTINEIARLNVEYEKLLNKINNSFMILNIETIDRTIYDFEKILIDSLQLRFFKRNFK